MRAMIIWGRAFCSYYNVMLMKIRNRRMSKLFESVIVNLDVMQAIEAAKTAALFEREHLSNVPFFKSRKELFRHCLQACTHKQSLHLEFGVYKGDSLNLLAKIRPKQLFFGFDTFTGLPENWTMGGRKGALSTRGRFPAVRKNVSLIKGLFDQTLPPFIQEHQTQNVSFIHIDCDLYSSTKVILESLRPMISAGTVICFDELYNYTDWQQCEYKALLEFVEKYNIKFEYIGYIRKGTQVAIKILS